MVTMEKIQSIEKEANICKSEKFFAHLEYQFMNSVQNKSYMPGARLKKE